MWRSSHWLEGVSLVLVVVEWILPPQDCEEAWGSTRAWHRPGDADVSHEVSRRDAQCHQRVECIIMVCVTYSIPLFSTLSPYLSPILLATEDHILQAAQLQRPEIIEDAQINMQFFDCPPFFFLGVSSHCKTIWWNPDIGDRRTDQRHAFDFPMITIINLLLYPEKNFQRQSESVWDTLSLFPSPDALITPLFHMENPYFNMMEWCVEGAGQSLRTFENFLMHQQKHNLWIFSKHLCDGKRYLFLMHSLTSLSFYSKVPYGFYGVRISKVWLWCILPLSNFALTDLHSCVSGYRTMVRLLHEQSPSSRGKETKSW